MKKEKEKILMITVCAAVLLLAVAAVIFITVRSGGQTAGEPTARETAEITPIRPGAAPTVLPERVEPDPEDPTREVEEPGRIGYVLDVGEEPIHPERKETPEIAGEVVFLPGVREAEP